MHLECVCAVCTCVVSAVQWIMINLNIEASCLNEGTNYKESQSSTTNGENKCKLSFVSFGSVLLIMKGTNDRWVIT